MAEKPTASWREGTEEERRELAAGILVPESLIGAMGGVLYAFEAILQRLQGVSYDRIFAAVHRCWPRTPSVRSTVVVPTRPPSVSTLCAYIDPALTEQGVVALTAPHGLGPHQLTDKWRESWRCAPVKCTSKLSLPS